MNKLFRARLRPYGVAAIADALFRDHGWDWDRAVCAVYWFKNGKRLEFGLLRFTAMRTRVVNRPSISGVESAWLLTAYDRFRRG